MLQGCQIHKGRHRGTRRQLTRYEHDRSIRGKKALYQGRQTVGSSNASSTLHINLLYFINSNQVNFAFSDQMEERKKRKKVNMKVIKLCTALVAAYLFETAACFSFLPPAPSSSHSPSSSVPVSVPAARTLHKRVPSCCHRQSRFGTGGTSTCLRLFDFFEEAGPLGKGITVGQVSVCLRRPSSIIGKISSIAKSNSGTTPGALSGLASQTCLALLRSSDDWVSACGKKTKYGSKQGGKAESDFNRLASRLASKYEKEYSGDSSSSSRDGSSSNSAVAVVTLLLEIEGDETPFEPVGRSFSDTRDALQVSGTASVSDSLSGRFLFYFILFYFIFLFALHL